MFPCDDHTYCCDLEDCNCKNRDETLFFRAAASAFTTIGIFQTSTASTSSVSTTASASLKASPPSSRVSQLTISNESLQIATASSNQDTTTSGSPSPSISSPNDETVSTPFSSSQSQPKPDHTVKIGVDIGVPVGFLLISAIALFAFWRERRLKGHMQELRSRWIPVDYFAQGNSTIIEPRLSHGPSAGHLQRPLESQELDHDNAVYELSASGNPLSTALQELPLNTTSSQIQALSTINTINRPHM